MENKLVPRDGAKAAWKIEFDHLCTQYNLGAFFKATGPPTFNKFQAVLYGLDLSVV